MSHSIDEACKRINGFSSPYLKDCSLALYVEPRNCCEDINATMLDEITASTLPKIIGFDARFTIDEAITGSDIVDDWKPEPREDDFENSESFEEAYEKHYPKDGDRKPWKRVATNGDLRSTLSKVLSWSINNKSYAMPTPEEPQRRIAFSFSTSPHEQKEIERQETDHQDRINKLCEDIALVFNSNGTQVFVTEHLFDFMKPPLNTESDQLPEPYHGCFLDETYILLDCEYRLTLWVGRFRHYG